jgi:ATP-dependent exoDNAse (exonuclease V) alpha subunit
MRRARVGGEVFHERDRVLVTRNDYRLQVRNGDLGTIRTLDPARRRIEVRLDDGREVSLPYAEFPHLSLGYALTTHKAQGATVKHAYVLAGGPMADREMSYVTASRARQETRFFTHRVLEWDPDAGKRVDATFETLVREMTRSRRKDLAHDAAGAPAPGPAAPALLPLP